ncbi:purine-cytosine permease family protein [Streptomyces sp. NPDC048496]|uniref:purine-cytosine permease family protein n=1 Tax=Streptomyces sp. NPDC048496 TaxID=3365558 RepID=UPI00371AEA98
MPAAPTQKPVTDSDGSHADRIPRLSLMMGWWSLVSAMFYLYIAGLVASTVGFTDTVIGLLLTVAVFGLVNRALAGYAIDTGFGVERFSQLLFGRVGSVLATLVFAATALYYGVFEGSIIAATLEAYTRDSLGWSINVWYFIVVAYATPLVFGGVRNWLDKLNGLLLPLYAAGLVAAVVVAAVSGEPAGWTGSGAQDGVPFAAGGPGWLMAFGIYMGVWILMMYTVDFAQLGRPQDRRFHTTVTFGWVFYAVTFLVNGLVGIFLSHALRSFVGSTVSEGGVAVALTHVMGIWAVLLVFVSQTRINTANYFLASSNLEILGSVVFRLRLPRVVWVLVGSAIIFLIMLTNVFSYILTALNWQGVLVTGWVAIALTHVAMDRHQGVDPAQAETRTTRMVSLPGVVGWGAGSLVGLVVLETGPAWATTWGPILTAVCACGVYATLRAVTGAKGSPLPETDAVTTAV